MPLLDMINHEEQDCGANAFVWSSSSSEAGDAAALPSPGQQVDVAAQQPPAEPGCEKADELPQLPVEHLEQSLAGLSLAAATSDVATPAPPPAAPAPPLWHGGGGGGGGGGACSCHQPLTDWARGWRRHVTLRSKVPLRAGQQVRRCLGGSCPCARSRASVSALVCYACWQQHAQLAHSHGCPT